MVGLMVVRNLPIASSIYVSNTIDLSSFLIPEFTLQRHTMTITRKQRQALRHQEANSLNTYSIPRQKKNKFNLQLTNTWRPHIATFPAAK
jgi:hypothetical protein